MENLGVYGVSHLLHWMGGSQLDDLLMGHYIMSGSHLPPHSSKEL